LCQNVAGEFQNCKFNIVISDNVVQTSDSQICHAAVWCHAATRCHACSLSDTYSTYLFRQRLCSRLTALWRYINFVLLLLLLLS